MDNDQDWRLLQQAEHVRATRTMNPLTRAILERFITVQQQKLYQDLEDDSDLLLRVRVMSSTSIQ